MSQIWAGVDLGKEHHHCVVLDAEGARLPLRRVLNDETALTELISDVLALSGETLWAARARREVPLKPTRTRWPCSSRTFG